MGKNIMAIAPFLWDLLGVLLDADPTRRRVAPKVRKSQVNEDVEMDLGEIGTEDTQYRERNENWAALEGDEAESSSEEEDEAEEAIPLMPFLSSSHTSGEQAESSSETDSDGSGAHHVRGPKKRTRRKQNPAKRNAVLLAIVVAVPRCMPTVGFRVNKYRIGPIRR